jgi:hypothetical protein
MKTLLPTLIASLSLGLFVACGSSDGPLSPEMMAPAADPVTGIEGAIAKNAQGQMLVGDVALNTHGGTTVTIDGRRCSSGDLQPGMIVMAEGEMGGGRFNCTSVISNSLLRGDIESIDAANNAIFVCGQRIVVDDNSYLARSCGNGEYAQAQFGGLCVGDRVSICGIYGEGGNTCATRVCVWPEGSEITTATSCYGIMSGLSTGSKTFQCGNITVNYGDALVTGAPVNGCQVFAGGQMVDGVFCAEWIVCQAAGNSGCRSYSGVMTGLDQQNYCFQLGGAGCCGGGSYWVQYDAATAIEINLASSQGAKIRVEGTVAQNGKKATIKATKITK